MTIKERLENINSNIASACARSGRSVEGVKLIAVTKTRTPKEINEAISLGIDTVGENRVQELLSKYDEIDKTASIHLIGQLQTNKVKYIIDKVSVIQSLDRISLADELEKECKKRNIKEIKTLIEVNIGQESTKSGIFASDLKEFLDKLMNLLYIKPIGLMTVAPADATEKEQMYYFEQMRALLDVGKAYYGEAFSELSMGMSRDYESAIKQGATMVRLGTALFGERFY